MVKQRNIFDQNRIDILTDTNEELTRERLLTEKEIIEAHNQGVKVFGTPKSKRKGYTDLPLFTPKNQTNLF